MKSAFKSFYVSFFITFILLGANFFFFCLTDQTAGLTFREWQMTKGEILGISTTDQAKMSELSLKNYPISFFWFSFRRDPIWTVWPFSLIWISFVHSIGSGLRQFSVGSNLFRVIMEPSHSISRISLATILSDSGTACLLRCRDWMWHCQAIAWSALIYLIPVGVRNLTIRQ